MIIIDGRPMDMNMAAFSNLEEILVQVIKDDYLEKRVVTDVLLNKEPFNEIYPHQAEDIEVSEIESLEIQTMPMNEISGNVSEELHKVIRIMNEGSRQIAQLFRQADDAEALEMLQDLLDVTRDFLGMVGLLRYEYVKPGSDDISERIEGISGLLGEMIEVLGNEDWILLADLLEYEFLPTVKDWSGVINNLQKVIPQ